MKNNQLINFYKCVGVDNKNRSLNEILKWNDEKLEFTHDYIQWLFPLKIPSQYNHNAPLLTNDDIKIFRQSENLKNNVLRAFKRMLFFYGFELKNNEVHKSITFEIKSLNWLTYRNHNFLRISRILQSLVLLGLGNYANIFFKALENIYLDNTNIIGNSFLYWKQAILNLEDI